MPLPRECPSCGGYLHGHGWLAAGGGGRSGGGVARTFHGEKTLLQGTVARLAGVASARNCFGISSRLLGQKRSPRPPAMITAATPTYVTVL